MTTIGTQDAGSFLHSCLKWMCSYWGESNGFRVEVESKGDFEDNTTPDLKLTRIKPKKNLYNPIYIEVQRSLRDGWMKRKVEKYGNKYFVVIDEMHYEKVYNMLISQRRDVLEDLYEILGEQLDIEVNRERPKNKKAKKLWVCSCGFKGNRYPHCINCVSHKREKE